MDLLVVIFRAYTFFFYKQKTVYEMRISDWSSDVCSSDLPVEQYRAVASANGARTHASLMAAGGGAGRAGAVMAAMVENVQKRKTKRSEEHTSELQSLMRNSYAVFCLKKKKQTTQTTLQKEFI